MIRSFSMEHHGERLRRVRSKMRDNNFDAVIFAKCETVRYVTGYRRWYTYSWFYLREFVILSTYAGPMLLVDKGRIERAKRACYAEDVRDSYLWPIPLEDRDAPYDAVRQAVNELGLDQGTIGIEFDFLPIDFFNGLTKKIPKAQFLDFSPLMNEVVAIKFGEEINAMREVARLADVGLRAGVKAAQPGKTEQYLAAQIDHAIMKEGAERASHIVIRTGVNVTELNNIQTDRVISQGDQVQMDLGAVNAGYFSDVNYTYILGQSTKQQGKLSEIALEMEKNAVQAIGPGVNTSHLREIIESTAAKAGYEEYMVRDIGHGIGIYHQEYPKLAEDNCQLEIGMVLCVEPGLNVPGVGASRIEDMVLVTENGFEKLTKFSPKEV